MTAMAPVTKFTFDLDFDAPEGSHQPESLEEEIEVQEEVVVPTFSEEELAQARAEGYASGKEDGRKESAEATEQRILETIETATAKFADIYNEQEQANQDIAKEMIQISTAIAKKMFPDLNARNALGEVERVVQDTLKAITDEPRIQIMVHPELREPLTDRLAAMTQRAGFEGKVYVNPDTTVNLGDCRVEWSHGAAVRDSETIMGMIDEIIKRNLHGENGETDDADEDNANRQTTETEELASSDPENIESVEEHVQSEPTAPIETTAEETDDRLDGDTTDDVTGVDNDHFDPNVNIDDDISILADDTETQQNQQVEPDIGQAPTPHTDLKQDEISDTSFDGATDNEDNTDEPGRMVNADPVSPDMTAAILDAQGAMSEEDEK